MARRIRRDECPALFGRRDGTTRCRLPLPRRRSRAARPRRPHAGRCTPRSSAGEGAARSAAPTSIRPGRFIEPTYCTSTRIWSPSPACPGSAPARRRACCIHPVCRCASGRGLALRTPRESAPSQLTMSSVRQRGPAARARRCSAVSNTMSSASAGAGYVASYTVTLARSSQHRLSKVSGERV